MCHRRQYICLNGLGAQGAKSRKAAQACTSPIDEGREQLARKYFLGVHEEQRQKKTQWQQPFTFNHQLSAKKLAISFVLFESEMQGDLREGNLMNMGNMGSVWRLLLSAWL